MKDQPKFLILFLIFILGANIACEIANGNYSSEEINISSITFIDSIPLFYDSLVFESFELNTQKDKMLLYGGFTGVYELNLKNKKITKIVGLGKNQGEINNAFYITKYLPNSNNILVAELLSYGKIYVINKERGIINSINYTKLFPERIAPFICSSINIISSNKDSTLIGISIQDDNVPGYTYSMLLLKDSILSYQSSQFNLSKNDFFRQAQKKAEKYSPFLVPRTCFSKGDIYFKFIFDKDFYICDLSFSDIKKIELKSYYDTYNFSIKNGEPQKQSDDIKQNFCNLFVESFDIFDNKGFIIYPKPIKPELSPKSIEEVSEFGDRKRVVHIINFTSEQQTIIPLPEKIDGHNIKVISNSEMYLLGNNLFQEDNYIYKVKY